MRNYKYKYRCCEGAGKYGPKFTYLPKAKQYLSKLQNGEIPGIWAVPNATIERIRIFPNHGEQYECLKNGKWIDWFEACCSKDA